MDRSKDVNKCGIKIMTYHTGISQLGRALDSRPLIRFVGKDLFRLRKIRLFQFKIHLEGWDLPWWDVMSITESNSPMILTSHKRKTYRLWESQGYKTIKRDHMIMFPGFMIFPFSEF